jgi:glyoxylase-like metal-dependent hydrolase (beta-lactamase superfamily II)
MHKQIAPQVTLVPDVAVNAYLVGERGGPWVFVDALMPGKFDILREAAEAVYGADATPEAIILTHGHIDHYGSALALATYYDVPIYAHRLDFPYLTGREMMPPKDPTVGGFFAQVARFLPESGTDLGESLRELPEDGSVPGMPGWKWHPTPGHTPGHISLFREQDRVLLAGDAVLTIDLDSTGRTLSQAPKLAHPPSPMTYDWLAARRSIEFLATLRPYTIASGHGVPMSGPDIAQAFEAFAADFISPLKGRYIAEPVRFDENGIVYLPPPVADPLPKLVAGVGIATVLIGAGLYVVTRQKDKDKESQA